MRTLFVVSAAVFLVFMLTSCESLSNRYQTYDSRHPCGNVWNVCYGDPAHPYINKMHDILNGTN